MSNQLYDKARELFLTEGIHWTSDTIDCWLLSTTGYTVNISTHNFFDDVPNTSNARRAGPVTLASKTTTGGAADADDVTFSAVSGIAVQIIALVANMGSDATSPLIAYIDMATGLPITPNGGDIIVTWDSGTNKIFRV